MPMLEFGSKFPKNARTVLLHSSVISLRLLENKDSGTLNPYSYSNRMIQIE